MPGPSVRIMRIAGIPLGVQPLWLLIVALITWSLGADYYPSRVDGIAPVASYALGLLSALLLFASVVAHEFGHALTARRHGVEVEGIDLWLLGGVAKMHGQAHRPEDELRYAAAGPAVSLVIATVFWLLALVLPDSTPGAVTALVGYQAFVNSAILVFNLLPAFPLDGGRVTRALIWKRRGDLAGATATAAGIGRAFGWFFVAIGVLDAMGGVASGLWIAVIGLFIIAAASAEARQAALSAALAGYRMADIMSAPAVSIPASATVADALALLTRHRIASLPVTDGGRAVGLLTLQAAAAVPAGMRETTPAGSIADDDPSLLVGPDEDASELLELPAFARDGRAIVVEPDGEPEGVVSVTDIERLWRARSVRR